MSITNSEVITDALRELGVIDETESPSAEQGADGLRKLNQMMETWDVGGISLEYFAQTVLSDTCPIPAYAEMGVTCSLAIRLAPTYRAQVSAELAANAEAAMRVILREAVSPELPVATMQNRPLAEGDNGFFSILDG